MATRRLRHHLRAVAPASTTAEHAALQRLAAEVAECVAEDAELQRKAAPLGGGDGGRGPLSAEQLAFYERWGLLHLRAAYSPDEMRRISVAQHQAAMRFAGGARGQGWSLADCPTLSRMLLEDERFLGTMAQLLGEDFICYSCALPLPRAPALLAAPCPSPLSLRLSHPAGRPRVRLGLDLLCLLPGWGTARAAVASRPTCGRTEPRAACPRTTRSTGGTRSAPPLSQATIGLVTHTTTLMRRRTSAEIICLLTDQSAQTPTACRRTIQERERSPCRASRCSSTSPTQGTAPFACCQAATP